MALERLEILQEALEHPERLLVHLDPADDKVLSLEVICGSGCLAERVPGAHRQDQGTQ